MDYIALAISQVNGSNLRNITIIIVTIIIVIIIENDAISLGKAFLTFEV